MAMLFITYIPLVFIIILNAVSHKSIPFIYLFYSSFLTLYSLNYKYYSYLYSFICNHYLKCIYLRLKMKL